MAKKILNNRYQYDPEKDFIGQGSYGKVYRARDLKNKKTVALKIPATEAPVFENEHKITRLLPPHCNIAVYQDYGVFISKAVKIEYAVLDYYKDGSLYHLKNEGLSKEQKNDILKGILKGISHLHKNEVIHCDIKPANILITKTDDRFIPKITDFGTAIHPEVSSANIGLGSPLYSSPEQQFADPIKKNSDLWAFGMIVFELFTGDLPFTYKTKKELLLKLKSQQLADNIDTIPEPWNDIVKSCLILDPEKRIQDVASCLKIVLDAELDGQNTAIKLCKRKYKYVHYDEICGFHGKLARVKKNGKFGFINKQGEVIIDIIYDEAIFIDYGLIRVGINHRYGLLNQKNEFIIPMIYDLIDYKFSEGLIPVVEKGKIGFFNKSGRQVIRFNFLSINGHNGFPYGFHRNLFSEGFVVVSFLDGLNVINKKGEVLFAKNIKHCITFEDLSDILKNKERIIYAILNQVNKERNYWSPAKVEVNDKWEFISKQKKTITFKKYNSPIKDTFICTEKGSYYGSIYKRGSTIVPFEYDLNKIFDPSIVPYENNPCYDLEAEPYQFFHEGLVCLKKNGKAGFVDKQGSVVVPFIYDEAFNFSEGLAPVMLNGKRFWIDKEGKKAF